MDKYNVHLRNVHPHVHRAVDNLGRTIGLNEEQQASQEAGIQIGFGKKGIECHLAPSDDKALRRLIRRVEKKQNKKTINIER